MDDKYKKLAERIGSLVDEKNAAYGNSFKEAGSFLALLYPDGISPDKYGDMLCIVRIFDKLKRIATKKGAFNESPYVDIVGYGLLGTMKDEEALAEEKELGPQEYVVDEKEEKEINDLNLLEQLKNTAVVRDVSKDTDYLILKIMEEGKSIRLAPLKKNRPQYPYIAEELSEVVETNIVEMGLKELIDGLSTGPGAWCFSGLEAPQIFGECHFCKSLLEDGVPVKNMINGDKFAHPGCFEDHLKSLKKDKNGEPEHQNEGEVVDVGIDVGSEDYSRKPPEPSMVIPFKNKRKFGNIKKKGTFVRHGR